MGLYLRKPACIFIFDIRLVDLHWVRKEETVHLLLLLLTQWVVICADELVDSYWHSLSNILGRERLYLLLFLFDKYLLLFLLPITGWGYAVRNSYWKVNALTIWHRMQTHFNWDREKKEERITRVKMYGHNELLYQPCIYDVMTWNKKITYPGKSLAQTNSEKTTKI